MKKFLIGFGGFLLVCWLGMVAFAYWPGEPEVPAQELAQPGDKFIDVNGRNIRYRTWGEPGPDKPNLVLIHGFANSLQTWRDFAPLVEDDYYVIALDLLGFGLSDKPTDHLYYNDSQAAVVGDFIRALELEEVIIGGHSLGGTLALHVAIKEPEAKGMVLFNPGIISTGVPPITEYLFFPLPRLSAKQFGTREFRYNFLKASYVNPDILTEDIIDDLMLASRSEGYLDGGAVMMSHYVSGEEVAMTADVKVPTLMIWGRLDRGKPENEATDLQAMIEGAELAMIENAGHYVHEEKPEDSAAALIAAKPMWDQPAG